MKRQTIIVTGASGAIGKAIARQLAVDSAYEVVLACRDELKAKQVTDEINAITKHNNASFEIVDLSSHHSIMEFARRWQGTLDVLLNNAATAPVNRIETAAGIEMQFATNVLGYFWMTMEFAEHLKKSTAARIVNVASYWAGDLDMDDLEFSKRHYNNNMAYRQSKQANRMLTVAFAERFKKFGITVNACHPGDVNSKLSNDLGFGGSQEAASGAKTPVWLATHDFPQNITGSYFERNSEAKCSFSNDKQAIETLYSICQSY